MPYPRNSTKNATNTNSQENQRFTLTRRRESIEAGRLRETAPFKTYLQPQQTEPLTPLCRKNPVPPPQYLAAPKVLLQHTRQRPPPRTRLNNDLKQPRLLVACELRARKMENATRYGNITRVRPFQNRLALNRRVRRERKKNLPNYSYACLIRTILLMDITPVSFHFFRKLIMH